MIQFSLSALVAVATPAVAAGLVSGTSAALETGNTAIASAIYSKDDGADTAANIPAAPATHEPARLSVLAGNDQKAWNSAHSVHVNFSRKQH